MFARLDVKQIDVFQDEELLEQLLQILFCDFYMQVAQNAPVDVVFLNHFLGLTPDSQHDVGVSQVVHHFVGSRQSFPYLLQHRLKVLFDFFGFLLDTVNDYQGHFLVRFNKTLLLVLEFGHLQPIVFPELLESRSGNTVELKLNLTQILALPARQFA